MLPNLSFHKVEKITVGSVKDGNRDCMGNNWRDITIHKDGETFTFTVFFKSDVSGIVEVL
jgi:hypothetical protein